MGLTSHPDTADLRKVGPFGYEVADSRTVTKPYNLRVRMGSGLYFCGGVAGTLGPIIANTAPSNPLSNLTTSSFYTTDCFQPSSHSLMAPSNPAATSPFLSVNPTSSSSGAALTMLEAGDRRVMPRLVNRNIAGQNLTGDANAVTFTRIKYVNNAWFQIQRLNGGTFNVRRSTDLGAALTATQSAAGATAATVISGAQISSINFAAGNYLATNATASTTAHYYLSSDGITWTAATFNGANSYSVNHAVFFGDRWYAVTTGGLVFRSAAATPSTTTWTQVHSAGANVGSIEVIAGKLVILPGSGGQARYSSDGTTWTNVTVTDSGQTQGSVGACPLVAWNGMLVGLINVSGTNAGNRLIWTTDGVTWLGRNLVGTAGTAQLQLFRVGAELFISHINATGVTGANYFIFTPNSTNLATCGFIPAPPIYAGTAQNAGTHLSSVAYGDYFQHDRDPDGHIVFFPTPGTNSNATSVLVRAGQELTTSDTVSTWLLYLANPISSE